MTACRCARLPTRSTYIRYYRVCNQPLLRNPIDQGMHSSRWSGRPQDSTRAQTGRLYLLVEDMATLGDAEATGQECGRCSTVSINLDSRMCSCQSSRQLGQGGCSPPEPPCVCFDWLSGYISAPHFDDAASCCSCGCSSANAPVLDDIPSPSAQTQLGQDDSLYLHLSLTHTHTPSTMYPSRYGHFHCPRLRSWHQLVSHPTASKHKIGTDF